MYQTPLEYRLKKAAEKRRTYRNNPDMRLRTLNRARRNIGLPPLESLSQSDRLRLPVPMEA